MEERLRYVKVTNKFETPFVDMYDGVPVTIDAGGSQNLRPDQALHFFGYVEGATKKQMLLHTSKRQGWNSSAHLAVDESGKSLAERMFDKIVIEPITYRLVEETPATDQPIPAEPSLVEEEVETAPPPPKFTPAKPQAKGKPQGKRGHPLDDE